VVPAEGDRVRDRPTGQPGPESVRLPARLADAIVAHARGEAPAEACGVIIGSGEPGAGGLPLRYEPCRNELASAVRFRIHPEDVYRLVLAADAAGEAFWGIVHSHVRTHAVPSATDVEAAAWWPSALHLLVSLDEGEADPVTGAPSLRAWRIVEGEAVEVPLARA
jgi:proteasome lid subunit RPN8/RPN11